MGELRIEVLIPKVFRTAPVLALHDWGLWELFGWGISQVTTEVKPMFEIS